MRAPRGSETVNEQIDFAEIAFDQLDGLQLDFVGKCIAVNALRVQTLGVRDFLECRRVIPARARRTIVFRWPLKKNADRSRIAAECRDNPRSKPVARGCANDENALWRIGD